MKLLSWLRRLLPFGKPLIRTRAVGRPRTYSADAGYVYEYAFAGFRRVSGGPDTLIEYVFTVSTNRSTPAPVSVVLPESVLLDWATAHRELTSSERYGIAKMLLKRGMDEWPGPRSIPRSVVLEPPQLQEITEILDL